MKYCVYEDQYCYYIWKPAGQHSTFGKEYSFLEQLRDERDDQRIVEIFNSLKSQFSEKEEFGLLNRLDTPTTGLLYFAKTPEIKHSYKALQQEGKVYKKYLLQVWGDLGYYVKKSGWSIEYPIAHHKYLDDRMVAISIEENLGKIKGRLHHLKTKIEHYSYDEMNKTTTVLVSIQKGIRHQIRSHFSSIGYALLGDEIYGKKKDPFKGKLQLYSVGLEVRA